MFPVNFKVDILQKDNCEKVRDAIDSAIRSRKIECSSLKSRHRLYWSELFSFNTFEWDAKLKEVRQLQTFDFEKVRGLYDEKLLFENGKTKCAVFQIWKQTEQNSKGNEQENEDDEGAGDDKATRIRDVDELNELLCEDLCLDNIRWNEIDDICAWQNSLNCLPSYL